MSTVTTISQAYDLPGPQDIRAMNFVVRLKEADPGSDEVRQLVKDYVVTPVVERELPKILEDMKQVYDRGEEYGRFLHGSFGSGKSHLMTMLGLLLENAAPAWDKFRTCFKTSHESWLGQARLLVVRIHMLSVRGKSTGLDRVVYEGFNDALKKRGKQTFEFLNVERVFDEARREADEYGDLVWKKLELANIVGGREEFEQIAAGPARGRESFARAWLSYKGRDPGEAGIDPRWSDGLKRMAEHAKGQGFGGIVLMIDEFLLWLAEKSAAEFATEINNLNVIVDHNTGQRALPIFVFVARQRNLKEFFPDLVDEAKIHEHLDHHAKRFEETRLQDVELRHVVKGRVLHPHDPAAVQAVVAQLEERHKKVLPVLMGESGIEYLRDVYPFHPALIEMLVDVTSLMQRERSALRLLYELLVIHYPDLPLGEFLPVGSAFAAIFPEAGVEASKKVELMQEIHQQYYMRLAPAMARMVEEQGSDFNPERRRALDQIVKTVLLAEVSPRLKQSGLTIERLVQLNEVDVEGETFRGKVRVAETDLLSLAQKVPDLQIAGTGKVAIVRYILGRVSLTEVLARARSKVDNPTARFKVYWAALKDALGLTGQKGFEEGGNEGDWELTWRRTRRRGRIKLGNVREMTNEDFEPPPGTFKLLVDYPWDEPGHSVDEDRMRAGNARKKLGNRYTACWLPRHLSPTELDVLTELAAVRYLQSDAGQTELLETHSKGDRSKLIEQANIRENTLKGQLKDLLVEVYVRHGEFQALISDVDSARPKETLAENLEHIATLLMDRRYPQHPHFGAEPRKADLEALLGWMVQASTEANASVAYDEQAGKALKTLGQPLELVNLGQTKASLRLDSRYIKEVLQRVDQDTVAWTPIAEHLRDTYGFLPQVVDLFLCFICQRDHRALAEGTSDPVETQIGMPVATRLRLQRGQLVSHTQWPRLRELGHQLFEVKRPAAQRSLQLQDRFAGQLVEAGQERRGVLMSLHKRLVNLGVAPCPRLEEVAAANERLAPLARATTDSYRVVSELLAQWPEGEEAGALVKVVHECAGILDALADLNENDRANLRSGMNHPDIGIEAERHLVSLEKRLTASQSELPLAKGWIAEWNKEAAALVKRLVSVPPRPDPDPDPDPDPTPTPASRVLISERFNPSDADAVSDFLAQVRKALAGLGNASVKIILTSEEPEP